MKVPQRVKCQKVCWWISRHDFVLCFIPSVISVILLLGLLLSLSFGLQKDFLNQIVVFLLIILQFKSKNTQ